MNQFRFCWLTVGRLEIFKLKMAHAHDSLIYTPLYILAGLLNSTMNDVIRHELTSREVRMKVCFCGSPQPLVAHRLVYSNSAWPVNWSHPKRRPPCRRHRPRTCQSLIPSAGLWTPNSQPPRHQPPKENHSGSRRNEFGDWSEEFTTLCKEQLELLQATIPNVASGTVLFRREHATTGALEFIPVATYPNDPRVWIAHGAIASEPVGSRVLPGGIPADWILPDYPFLNEEDARLGFVGNDGSLCVPIMFSSVVAGSLVLRRAPAVPKTRAWAESDVARVRIVARSIALAAQLEGRWLAASQALRQDSDVLQSLGELIRGTVHQIRSPITALVTFGRVLLRRLPVGDENRSIAKSILVEGFRLDDLLGPLDEAGDRLQLPAVESAISGEEQIYETWESQFVEGSIGTGQGGDEVSVIDLVPEEKLSPELFWISDILLPIAEANEELAEARGRTFVFDIDEDAPPVMGHEKGIREVVHNFLDNAIKYTPRGGVIGMRAGVAPEDPDVVEIVVWDTGPGIGYSEQSTVWHHGQRGAAGLSSDESGSGLGLAIAKNLVEHQNGELTLVSPIPSEELSSLLGDKKVEDEEDFGPGSLFRVTLRRPGR